jgi:type IV secretory pathway VirB4 component
MGDKVFIIDPEREYQFLATSNHGNWFDCSKSIETLNFENKLTVLDFFNLLDLANRNNFDEKIFIILQKIEQEIQRNYLENKQKNIDNKFVILIDEAHLLINQKDTLLFIYQLTKRIRKYNGSIVVITQNLSDFFANKETKEFSLSIIKNCNYSALFKATSGDVNDLAKLLKNNPLSEKEQLMLPQLELGNCLFNLSANTRFLLQVQNLDKESELF